MTANDFAAETVRRFGMPSNPADLLEMLRLAFTQGEIQGALDKIAALNRIINGVDRSAEH